MTIEQLFFQLLQVAIGTRKTLDRLPTSEEWALLFDMSKKQALTAVAFTGVTRLNESSDFGASLGIPEVVYLKWLGLTAKVAQRNKEVSVACVELVKQYAHDGLSTCILKGQSNLINYPEKLKECRTPGDIDIWVKPADPCGLDIAVADLDGKGAHGVYTERSRSKRYHGKEAVIEYVKMLWRLEDSKFAQEGQTPLCKNEEPEVRYHHIDAPSIGGVDVEAHFRPLFLDSPLRNWRLQRWFRENEQFDLCSAKFAQEGQTPLCKKSVGELVESIPIPTVSFNAVYQLCHIYRHLFDEGIGLRQLLDYYFVLRALHLSGSNSSSGLCGGLNCPKGIEPIEPLEPLNPLNQAQAVEPIEPLEPQKAEIMHTLSRFGMKKFASATMYVLQTVFAMPDEYLLCQPNEKEGKFLLNEIMQAGNFGKYDTRISHETPSIPLLKGKKVPQQLWHAWEKLKHNFRLIRHYPEEVLWEPFFRIYHYLWRKLRLWRF